MGLATIDPHKMIWFYQLGWLCELTTVKRFTLSTQLMKPNYLVILPTDATPQFLSYPSIDPYSDRAQTKLYKIPKFVVNRPRIVSKIQLFENVKIYREMSGWPNISLLILISVKTSLINTKLGSIVAYPMIYRLVPSPFRIWATIE